MGIAAQPPASTVVPTWLGWRLYQRLLSLVFAVVQGSIFLPVSVFFLSWLTSLTPRSMKVLFVNPLMCFYFLTRPTAYEEVRSNKSDINWVLIDYEVRL
jgi:uncharacterized membrane protein (DUF2068 family)